MIFLLIYIYSISDFVDSVLGDFALATLEDHSCHYFQPFMAYTYYFRPILNLVT